LISKTGRYKRFMQIGIVTATVMVALLATLTPQSPYLYEAAIMFVLGGGLGVVMPVLNLAIQNEFAQHELGAATSSNQLFRSLGSTIGIAVFGAMLTSGLTTGLVGIHDQPYLAQLRQSPTASKIGNFDDSNTLLNLNAPDVKHRITTGFNTSVSTLPMPLREKATQEFTQNQSDYANKITKAFSDSLQRIFLVSAGLMLVASVLVFTLKERQLKSATPDQTPGEI
jgi:hypothetical protein